MSDKTYSIEISKNGNLFIVNMFSIDLTVPSVYKEGMEYKFAKQLIKSIYFDKIKDAINFANGGNFHAH